VDGVHEPEAAANEVSREDESGYSGGNSDK
jgi:hypothetical protein